ncbi:FKBP-type peptidyl-prolyl cis-trans isomerase [Budviciaceae bacterium BWR-B9]|uniref:peptidylprolyl isomerase n=1 Tax=Limnobaculum allomyrinae TaxID=2791986 RepID=A0ABS1IQS7_9GAMM|nr:MULTISPECIES: FKBP-type peptidyl-prolyl cis-trans isomerase [Limnobaculum]MBK5144110.1 FKBP-type peptidyl-prolyl cis-trans isomerase [Limnobaculum allomyrinae]MBV7691769.1 FKBP-type peptidyl-prolyl cis-trans isomerase [Limnobaculum sp. M2-1]
MSFLNKPSYAIGALLLTLPVFTVSANPAAPEPQVEQSATVVQPATTAAPSQPEAAKAEQPVDATPVTAEEQKNSQPSSAEPAKDNVSDPKTNTQQAVTEPAATNSTPVAETAPVASETPAAVDAASTVTEKAATTETAPTDAAPVSAVSEVASTVEPKKEPVPVVTELETTPLSSVKFSLNSEEQKRAYASGVTLARYLQENMAQQKKLHITLDPNIVLAGIVDTFAGDIKMDEAMVKKTMAAFDDQVNTLNKAKMEQEAAREREMGDAYQAEFAKMDGVKKSKTGLLYLVEKKGTGAAIADKDIVVVELQGMRVNGTVFEKTASPITLKVADVIPALRSGIKLAGRGGEIKLVVPPEQGYGAKGALPGIPPNATLIFSIKVLQVNPAKAK